MIPAREKELIEYRNMLLDLEFKAGQSYDKAVLTLSGGALGVSFVFIKNIIGMEPVISYCPLLVGWICFTTSLLSLLVALYFATLSYRKTVKQIDETFRKGEETDGMKEPGGLAGAMIPVLNLSGLVFFVAGVLFLFFFAYQNL